MQPIETWYNGTLFASLLEARWAVFFDAAGIPWEYEHLGYKLGELGKTWYLPDFWLPEQRGWVEIKPYSEVSDRESKKIKHFQQALKREPLIDMGHDLASKHFYIFVGSPYYSRQRHGYEVFFVLRDKLPWEMDDISQIPPLSELKIVPSQARWTQCPLCHHLQVGLYHHLRDVNNVIRREYLDCEYCCRFKPLIGETQKQEGYVTRCSEEYEVWTTRIGYILGSPQLMRGYTAARKFKAPRKRT